MGEFTPTALLALLALFPLTGYIVWTKRPQLAVLYVFFLGTLFGPEGAYFKLPGAPPLDKYSLPAVILFGVAMVRWRPMLQRARLGRDIDVLLFLAVFAGFVTWQTNLDALRYGTTVLPGLQINDGIQFAGNFIVMNALPFVLGRSLFRTRRDVVTLLHFLAVAGLIQAALSLLEIRFSPQLHTWVYGYPAYEDFLQAMRLGGYRPTNFMSHGLGFSLFLCATCFCAVVLARVKRPVHTWPAKRVAVILFLAVLLCKSTGTIVYAVVFGAMLAFARPSVLVNTAFVVALFVGLYPMLRANDLVPIEAVLEKSKALFGEVRAGSLGFRFEHEGMLLEHARNRFWFGWGGFERNLVFDPAHGRPITIPDGHWVVVIGLFGMMGMLTRFGLLLAPLLLLRSRIRLFTFPEDRLLVAGLAFICTVLSFDLIPNGLFANYPYLLAGALWGVLQEIRLSRASWSTPPATTELRSQRGPRVAVHSEARTRP